MDWNVKWPKYPCNLLPPFNFSLAPTPAMMAFDSCDVRHWNHTFGTAELRRATRMGAASAADDTNHHQQQPEEDEGQRQMAALRTGVERLRALGRKLTRESTSSGGEDLQGKGATCRPRGGTPAMYWGSSGHGLGAVRPPTASLEMGAVAMGGRADRSWGGRPLDMGVPAMGRV
jgi:hypothetical protein